MSPPIGSDSETIPPANHEASVPMSGLRKVTRGEQQRGDRERDPVRDAEHEDDGEDQPDVPVTDAIEHGGVGLPLGGGEKGARLSHRRATLERLRGRDARSGEREIRPIVAGRRGFNSGGHPTERCGSHSAPSPRPRSPPVRPAEAPTATMNRPNPHRSAEALAAGYKPSHRAAEYVALAAALALEITFVWRVHTSIQARPFALAGARGRVHLRRLCLWVRPLVLRHLGLARVARRGAGVHPHVPRAPRRSRLHHAARFPSSRPTEQTASR